MYQKWQTVSSEIFLRAISIAELLSLVDWQNGIDTTAHLYSYNQLGKTIAVLGNGFNHIFPAENKELYKKILDFGGLIISEYPPDTKCQSTYFLERNRIVSGLSLGVLVIEAAHRSGTSVTAKLAISQNRKVFALPHEIWNSHGTGTNRLIKNGAILITDTEDILQELKCLRKLIKKLKDIQKIDLSSLDIDFEVFESSRKPVNSLSLSRFSTFTKSSNINSYIDTSLASQINSHSSNSSNIHSNTPLKSLDIQNKKELKNPKLLYIYDLISMEPISINEICKKTSKSISQVSNDLFLLELEGYIKKVAGGYICILNK